MLTEESHSKKPLAYLDFDLEIGPASQEGSYTISVLHSPSGEVEEPMRFPFSAIELENCLKDVKIALLRSANERRLALSPEEASVKNFGKALFNAVMTGEVRALYDSSQSRAATMQKGLRLKLRVKPPELSSVPWEFMYDPRRDEYVCLSSNTPLVRYIEVPQAVPPVSVVRPLKILGMIASPADMESLNVSREKLRLEKSINALREKGLVELTWIEGASWRDLQRAIRNDHWHIFHFIGHGAYDNNAQEGMVCFEDERGNTYRMDASQLGRILSDATSLRLVVLNSCEGASGGQEDIFSSTASILIRRGIPAILAMQYEISDKAAVEFSSTFYEALADGMPVDAATSEARKAISFAMRRSLEWATPVLFMRLQDGKLFDIDDALTIPVAVRKQQEFQSQEKAEKERLEKENAVLLARQKANEERLAREKAEAEKALLEKRMQAVRQRASQTAQPVAVPKKETQSISNQVMFVMGIFLLILVGLVVFWPKIWQTIILPGSGPMATQGALPVSLPSATHAFPSPPTMTLTPQIVDWVVPSTPTPFTTDSIPSAADDFVRFYFENINNRNYELTWSLLSAAYKAKTNPSGMDQYTSFWNKYTVNVTSVEQTHLTTSLIKVTVQAILTDASKSVSYKLVYYLNKENSQGIWLFDITPAKGGSSTDTTCNLVSRRLSAGIQAQVATAKDPLLLRETPAETAATLEKMPPGAIVSVIDGPTCQPYRKVYFWWWKVLSPSGKTGWVVEGSDYDDEVFIKPAR